MNQLVDTNVISELTRRRPNPGVEAWADRSARWVLSAITVEEIFYGLSRTPNERIQRWFEMFLTEKCDVMSVTETIAVVGGRLRGRLGAAGQTRTQADMLIGATALVHQQTLVTRNVRDFEGCGIALLNPFV